MAPEARMKGPEEIELPPSPPLELNNNNCIPPPASPFLALPSRPETPHSVSSPDLSAITTVNLSNPLTPKPRNRSPMSRGHLRSHSTASTLTLPPMQRAHSSPGVDSTGRFIIPPATGPHRPASPLGHSGRRRSPLRSAMEESYPSGPTWNGLYIEPNIPEHAELDISASTNLAHTTTPEGELGHTSLPSAYNTIPRSRRTSSSPLYHSSSTPNLPKATASPISGGSSPLLNAQRYANEPYPLHHAFSFGSGSSMPSTPTSFRSRSPSISSLETIPDTPDAEEAARVEEEEYLKNRAAAGGGEGEESDGRDARRKSSLEMRFGGKEKRKRWSVCGAERRGDFSLEVIEE
ncbi:hypothetical protein EPUS_05905 [Endocarpon pusillum Z07020]|uniref:Uncharacterized protein n=1 Tax=Endocarpon pusillum (strain Z07020 / HMAS-L-300199) TaxID=1263415 RepID=U1GNM0_ENDPU|nr:uncharacterized protein EPUS_05905 [Endocarpon pusillum Z07020]ERF73893.1 hypothetical protein EPUS_05905 [Endocarpon pusillum Z07020]